ncbi:phenylalanine--tRNA ligase subunit alpha [Candidatus Bathyarchaeota archaeon]|nr:phenylalanine--tRNA ligase subunit alpha [Candidatus Bathyarchaeota archaeon]
MSQLRENESKTLIALGNAGGRLSVGEIARASELDPSAIMRAVLFLESQNLVLVKEKRSTKIVLNEEGKMYADQGLPERRVVKELVKMGGEGDIDQVLRAASLDESVKVITLGWLNRKGWAAIDKETRKLKLLKEPVEGSDEKLLSLLKEKGSVTLEALDGELKDAVEVLKRRKIVDVHVETERELELSKAGWDLVKRGVETVKEVSQLTPEMLVTGKWRETKLRAYNIQAPVASTWPGKKHPYLRFLDDLKRKLVALGFKEMTGPTVELSFFNCDGLFMPQDHPAREVHDMYFIKDPERGSLERYQHFLEKVKKTHENGWKTGSKGWGYAFSTLEAARLMLRSQTTAASARMLIREDLEVPGKYFAIARCFRPDVIDKTHLTEFNQVEGIILGEDLTLVNLLGVLEKFAKDVAGADKVKYRPDYFPFTEPSVELVAYKKGYGWMEFGGSGIFRPELTLPLGIDVPVLAWGLGVDRLFMMKAEIDDIRYLFSQNLDWLRRVEMV